MATSRHIARPPTVDAALAALAASQEGPFTREQARERGLTPSMERSRRAAGRLFEIHPRVLALTPALHGDGPLVAALLWSQGALAAESVLAAHDLADPPPEIHVVVPGGGRPSTRGVVAHRARNLPRSDIGHVGRLPATTVARALLDVAPRTPAWRLRELVHEAQYRGLVDPLTLSTILDGHPGHPGLRALAAIEPAHEGAASGLERRLGRALRLVPGPPPDAQHWVTGASGRRYRGDFAFVAERVLIEADGRGAHARMLAFDADRLRDNDLAAVGWLALRYPGARLRDEAAVAAEVLATLVQRGGGGRIGR